MARGLGGTQESGLSQKAQLLPSGGREAQGLVQTPPPKGLSFPCWYVLGALPCLLQCPALSHRVLSAFIVEDIEAQRGRMTCLLSHISSMIELGLELVA